MATDDSKRKERFEQLLVAVELRQQAQKHYELALLDLYDTETYLARLIEEIQNGT